MEVPQFDVRPCTCGHDTINMFLQRGSNESWHLTCEKCERHISSGDHNAKGLQGAIDEWNNPCDTCTARPGDAENPPACVDCMYADGTENRYEGLDKV